MSTGQGLRSKALIYLNPLGIIDRCEYSDAARWLG